MKEFFKGIESFFVDFAFKPLDFIRDVQYDSWWLANLINIVFILIAAAAFIYWIQQLRNFQDDAKENASHSEH